MIILCCVNNSCRLDTKSFNNCHHLNGYRHLKVDDC
jgi:hypothetical protein